MKPLNFVSSVFIFVNIGVLEPASGSCWWPVLHFVLSPVTFHLPPSSTCQNYVVSSEAQKGRKICLACPNLTSGLAHLICSCKSLWILWEFVPLPHVQAGSFKTLPYQYCLYSPCSFYPVTLLLGPLCEMSFPSILHNIIVATDSSPLWYWIPAS